MQTLEINRTIDTNNLVTDLKDFGLNPNEWEIYTLESKEAPCFLIRSKQDVSFQMLGWTKKTRNSLKWDKLKLLSL